MRRKALALAVFALLAACGDGGQANQARSRPADIAATEAEDGATLALRRGQALEIRLHGNETIDPPLAWSLAAAPPNLRPSGEEVVSDDPEADGAGATWIFRFTAVAEGRGRLVFDGGRSGRQVGFVVVTAPGRGR
jgi:predicted secreted protein